MTIHKILRLSWLSVAALFWASCGDDSNSQVPVPESEVPDPESSSDDAVTSSSSSEETLSSAKEESSSSSEASSSSVASLSSEGKYILASDTSVTCDAIYEPSQTCITYYTCEDYQKYLGSDTTIAESLLMLWENKLKKCDFVHSNVALYGVMYKARESCFSTEDIVGFKCSNDSTYTSEPFTWVDSILYTMEEFESAYGYSFTEVSENMVKNCPHDEFSLFVDILADVQGALYEKIVKNLEENTSLTESQKTYLEGILDRENNKLKGNFAPYLEGDFPVEETTLDRFSPNGVSSANWFRGYIAKKQTCADGTPQITELYKEEYEAIYEEALELLNSRLANVK
ncbi:hypothetical protein [Fibrobacter sp.]